MITKDIYTRLARAFNELAAGGSEEEAGRVQLFGEVAAMFALLANNSPTKSVNASYTASDADGTIRVDASGGARTITLPSAASVSGLTLKIKKVDASANAVTVDANGAEVIDGALTKLLGAQYQSITIQSNGTSWDVL